MSAQAPDEIGTGASGAADPRPWWVVSDLHLGAVPAETEHAFHAFVAAAAREAAGLLINGDLFEFWFTTRAYRPPQHAATLAALRAAVQDGLRIVFLGGNRDAVAWDAGVLRDDIGLEVHAGPTRLTLGGRMALVAHGDRVPGVTPGLWGWLRSVPLQHRAIVGLVRALVPPRLVYATATRTSATPTYVARRARGESTGPKPAAPRLERWAREALAGDPTVDLVLAGHSHRPALVEVTPGRWYVNSGDWISHHSYVELPARLPGTTAAPPRVRVWPSRLPLAWEAVDDGTVPVSRVIREVASGVAPIVTSDEARTSARPTRDGRTRRVRTA